jgi:hypothetical protein
MFTIALAQPLDAKLHLADKRFRTEENATHAVIEAGGRLGKEACEELELIFTPVTENGGIIFKNKSGNVFARVVRTGSHNF